MEINLCNGCMEQFRGYPCPNCGYDPEKEKAPDYALGPGVILNGKYLVGRMLGQGGFGITYVGWDLALERKVAIKEYFPSGQVIRYPGTTTLQWYTTEQSTTARQNGKEMFLKEARKMSRVDEIPGVVGVRDLFQENDTAYIVMNFVEGETLKSRLAKTGPLRWVDAQEIFLPAIEAMEKVHQVGLIHRDISPDNLMLTPDGTVKILDLGAAKDLNVNSGASSMQVAKGGFSPLEQYTQRGGSGPWTDVYAMAATMYYALTGILPPAAVDRVEEDGLRWDLPQLLALPGGTSSALKQAMALHAKNRTQTMADFLMQLELEGRPEKAPKSVCHTQTNVASSPHEKDEGTEILPPKRIWGKSRILWTAVAAVTFLLIVCIGILLFPLGWEESNGEVYYYRMGAKVTGWQHIGENEYYFSPDGAMQTGWLYLDGHTYYFDGTGKMLTGEVDIASKMCTFDQDGKLLNKVWTLGMNEMPGNKESVDEMSYTIDGGGYGKGTYRTLDKPIENCRKVTVTVNITDKQGSNAGSWGVYVRDLQGAWLRIGEIESDNFEHGRSGSEYYLHGSETFLFEEMPVSFDAYACQWESPSGGNELNYWYWLVNAEVIQYY